MRRGTAVLLFVLLAASAKAQSIAPEDFGVQDFNYTFLSAVDFRPTDSATTSIMTFSAGTALAVFRTGGASPYFAHGFVLPPGALLESATAYVYDNDNAADITLYLCDAWRTTNSGATPDHTCLTGIGTTGVPGNTSILAPWNAYVPAVNNGVEYNYVVLVALGGASSNNTFSGVRLKWKRVVSPPPLTATFNDVPTNHLFFQYIEALAKSGITTGCTATPPQYCPDSFVTRGQMAVFLSRALGLHWSP